MITEQRSIILDSALKIERNLAILLSNLLYIQNIDTSKTLGNKSQALSFNTKADILLDTQFISDSDRKKFQLFMEIRNQFAHNIKCETFIDCVGFVDGSEKRLCKNYPIEYLDSKKEIQLKEQIINLIKDLNSIILKCQNQHKETLVDFLESEINSNAWESLKDSFISNMVRLDTFIDFPLNQENIKELKEKLIIKVLEDTKLDLEKKINKIDKKKHTRKLNELE